MKKNMSAQKNTTNVIFITGGAGFIGSAVIRYLLANDLATVVNIDKLTYAGNLENLEPIKNHPQYTFVQADICNRQAMDSLFQKYKPRGVMHLAAESHVDRSIDSPSSFIETNVVGTYTLLEASRTYRETLQTSAKEMFRFHHVSTDEVFGSLSSEGLFTETTPYAPNSPYSASKASSDHFARAWHHTYKLPVVSSNCSNNYGPYHFPEKLIPLMILNCIAGKALPVYGKGENIRDWLYVEDHARALWEVFQKGCPGETYNIGGNQELRNIEVVEKIADLMDEFCVDSPFRPHRSLISFVADRPGHDLRYAIDSTKIKRELGWTPQESFSSGLRKTVMWYLEHRKWWQNIQSGKYQQQRLGLGTSQQER